DPPEPGPDRDAERGRDDAGGARRRQPARRDGPEQRQHDPGGGQQPAAADARSAGRPGPGPERPRPPGPAGQVGMTSRWRGHPLARLGGTIARLPRYLRLAKELFADPAIPPARKAALGAGIFYVALPLDLIPGIVPILGQLDDLAALLLGLKTA